MKKRILSLLLTALLVVCIVPVFPATAAAAGDTTITIVHTNDVHARYVETDSCIGIAKVAGYVRQLERSGKKVLLMDAGDSIQGMLITGLTKGRSAINILNCAGYDYMALGNHEFDFGYGAIRTIGDSLRAKVLCSNVVKDNTGSTIFKGYAIKEINGIKIGIFGLSTPETKTKSHPNNTKGLTFIDPSKAAKDMVTVLKDRGCDYIIALGHLGIDDESEGLRSIDVVNNVDGIDLFIDGHSHSTLEAGEKVKDTLIVSTGEYLANIGEVTITFDADKKATTTAKLINTEAGKQFPEDKNTAYTVRLADGRTKKATSTVIGKTSVLLDGERANVRAGESNLARFATEVFMKSSEADAMITNGGGIRASIQSGNITIGDIFTVFPFGNTIVVKEMTGKQIKEALIYGTSKFPEAAGQMPQVAGITYKLKKTGGEPFDITVAGAALDEAKTYKVATNDFMAAGGDGYTMFSDAPLVMYYYGMEQMLIDFIKTNGVVFDDTPRLTLVD